ncbi:hypothetical protein Taro_050446 [Colocasia esculenta]|uniref:Uncharacterized protein n=1 Tax=Colocasia esculenta TaxID=4460 RepID=A0A843XDZ1_COLES|nr:hypothetical protein [Colocasia esculenta]
MARRRQGVVNILRSRHRHIRKATGMARRRQGVVKNVTGQSDLGSMIAAAVLSQSGRDMSGCHDETLEGDTSSRRVHRICARTYQSNDRFLDCGPELPCIGTRWFVQVVADERGSKVSLVCLISYSPATKSSSTRP